MSTYMYLECLDHNPPLRSEGEVGQHTYDLEDIRNYIAQREDLVKVYENSFGLNFDHHFASNAVSFLSHHQKCNIGIRDEYDREHPVTP